MSARDTNADLNPGSALARDRRGTVVAAQEARAIATGSRRAQEMSVIAAVPVLMALCALLLDVGDLAAGRDVAIMSRPRIRNRAC